jgi:signal peptidase I
VSKIEIFCFFNYRQCKKTLLIKRENRRFDVFWEALLQYLNMDLTNWVSSAIIRTFVRLELKGHKLPKNKKAEAKQNWVDSSYSTAEWLITAFAVTLVFLVFAMQAYTIPTGSMADTLKGAHYRLRCDQCAYRYDHGYSPQDHGRPENTTPSVNEAIFPAIPRCPSCGYYKVTAVPSIDPVTKRVKVDPKTGRPGIAIPSNQFMPVAKGDRIFVTKCIYQFIDPKRWDVIVFKNPLEPKINYIKRLIGLPGEAIEIVDGDIYVDGLIARKPDHLQNELWMPIYDNDYQPIKPNIARFNGHKWSQPFENAQGGAWNLKAQGSTVFSLDSETTQTINYNTNIGNDFRATYAYDKSSDFPTMPICSDLMMRFDVDQGGDAIIGASLSKYGKQYRAYVSKDSLSIGVVQEDGTTKSLANKTFDLPSKGRFEFSNVDHVLTVEYAGSKLQFDLGGNLQDVGDYRMKMPTASIFGQGKLQLQHVAIFRDIHYLGQETRRSSQDSRQYISRDIFRAGAGDPLTLDEDQFFVLGDNSPASLDGRWWNGPGKGNGGTEYRTGVVPRDYLVGKAFCVYWPGGSKYSDKSKIRLVPYIGGLKLIYGGKL